MRGILAVNAFIMLECQLDVAADYCANLMYQHHNFIILIKNKWTLSKVCGFFLPISHQTV